MSTRCDVAVIGGGPAGLAAADTLAGHGLDVRLLDENALPGGQLLRRPAAGSTALRHDILDRARRQARRLLTRQTRRGVTVESGCQVLGIFPPHRLLLQRADGRIVEMAARGMIVATGARERFLPFPGWTLPGVMAAGAAQILLKGSGILPAAITLVGGTGPLPLLLARQIAARGGRLSAVLDGASVRDRLRLLRLLPRQAPKLLHGAWLMAGLAAAGVAVRSNRWVSHAEGRDRLEAVVSVRLDRRGRPIPGSSEHHRCDGLAIGFGFNPNIELLRQAGCEMCYRTDRGGWVVCTDAAFETSIPDIFAAGEVTGIGGGTKALVEGRLCGLTLLERFGRAPADAAVRRRRLLAQHRHEVVFGALINRLCRVPDGWLADIPDETIVCRCEDVRLGDIRRRLADGFTTAGALKKATRCGMGNCQGRLCTPITDAILEAADAPVPPSLRAPVKPVSLGALAQIRRMPSE